MLFNCIPKRDIIRNILTELTLGRLTTTNMKKLLLLCLLFYIFSAVSAQKKDFTIGFGAGINVSGMTDNISGVSMTSDSRIGFKGYLFFDMPVSPIFSFQPELGYDGLGLKTTDPNTNLTYTAPVNYLTLALLPKIKVRGTGLSFIVGPSLGFLINARLKDDQGNSVSVTDSYNTMDVFAVGGVQYFFRGGFGVSARYMGGLTNIAKTIQTDESVHNHAWTFTMSYRIGSR
jgi:outer membrane immunogenic protein